MTGDTDQPDRRRDIVTDDVSLQEPRGRKFRRSAAQDPGKSTYDGFISYSHAADGRVGASLQAGLQSLGKPWYRRRTVRLFRDVSTLSATWGLWPEIERALGASRFLIVLTSPEAADSRWVNQEVAWWREHREASTCLIVLTSGRLEWDELRRDFADRSSVPPALRGFFADEPLWVDLRWATSETDVSLRNPRFRNAVADIAAPIRGLPKDELIGEDIRQHRRALRMLRGGLSLLTLLTVAAALAAVIALHQRNTAREQTRLATVRQLAAVAVAQIPTRIDVAQKSAVEAYRRQPTPEAEAALLASVTASPHLVRIFRNATTVTAIATASNGAVLLSGDANGDVRRWTVTGPIRSASIASLSQPVTAITTRGRFVAAGDQGGGIVVQDLQNPRSLTLRIHTPVADLALNASGTRVLVLGRGDRPVLTIFDTATRRVVVRRTLSGPQAAVAFRDGDARVFVGDTVGEQQLLSARTLRAVTRTSPILAPANGYVPAYSPERDYYGYYKYGALVTRTDPVALAAPNGAQRLSNALGDQSTTASTQAVTNLAVSSDGSRAAISTEAGIELLTAQPSDLFGGNEAPVTLTGLGGTAEALTFIPGGQMLASTSGSVIGIWDPNQVSSIATPFKAELPDEVGASTPPSLAVSHDGSRLAWVNESGDLTLADARTGRTLYTAARAPSDTLEFTQDGRSLLVTGGLASGGGVYGVMLDGAEPRVVNLSGYAIGDAGDVEAVRSGPSTILLFKTDGSVHAVDLGRRAPSIRMAVAPLATPEAGTVEASVNDAAYCPGSGVAFIVGGTLASPGSVFRRIELPDGRSASGPNLGLQRYMGVAVSDDCATLAAVDGLHSLVTWDMRRQRIARRIDVGNVERFALVPGRDRAMTISTEGTLAIWDLQTGTRVGSMALPHAGQNFQNGTDTGPETAWKFDNHAHLWTATAGGRLIRWDMSPNRWVEAACRTTGGGLTQQDWDVFVGPSGAPRFGCLP